ncbi:MAG: sigma-70 family RNA polymerase sigma factor [Myxococcota bacterium]
MEPLTPLVVAAQAGDRDAFTRLVARTSDAALAQARRTLGDAALAEDVVQDAMLDAYLRLGQLEEPAAFVGWLRRVVHKHADRRLRKRRERPAEVEAATRAPSAEELAAQAERQASVHAALDGLPEHEREAVALHYLAELPVREVAGALDASESAVKKRLWSARRRLREPAERMPRPAVATRVALFLAIRAGDVAATKGLLAEAPGLLAAPERWSDDEAFAAGTTLAHGLTPLVLAARRGDLAMVDTLLAAGASPAGMCACDAGETAVWAAFRGGHHAVAARLLERAPELADRPAGPAGWTCRDLARWRRDPALLALLGETGEPAPAPGPSPWPRAGRLETGLKAVDLWAPLHAGDLVRVHGAAETGLMVLLAELSRVVAAAGGVPVWVPFATHAWQRGELAEVAATYGLDGTVRIAPEGQLDAARSMARAARETAFTAVFVFEREGHRAQVDASLPGLREDADLVVRVRPWAAVTKGELAPPAHAGADVDLVTSPELAAAGVWPAIDPERSRRRSEGEGALAPRARAALAGPAREGLLAYLRQPFEVCAPDTGRPGEHVPRATLEADVARLLA